MIANQYQYEAMKTRLPTADIEYCVMNLAGEAGEVASLFAKARRDEKQIDKDNLCKELGDVCWQVAAVAHLSGLTLEEILEANLTKLKKRQKNNTLSGSGDER
jgi:NTP pyrophosphatase (non-canonical NTP hydrolase)